MLNKISPWLNIILLIIIIGGFVYFKRALSIIEEEKKEIIEIQMKENAAAIKPLEKEIKAHKDSLQSLKNENELIGKEMVKLKVKLQSYEEVRYYNDIDFTRASDILTNSYYRHKKSDNNPR